MKLKDAFLAALAVCVVAIGLFASVASADKPLIQESYDWIGGNDFDRFDDWYWNDEPAYTDYRGATLTDDDDPGCTNGYCGLYSVADYGSSFTEDDAGVWAIWPAGGVESYIASIDIDTYNYAKDPLDTTEPHATFGTLEGSPLDFGQSHDVSVTETGDHYFEGSEDTHAFYFGLMADDDVLTSSGRVAGIGEVTLEYGDSDTPVIDYSNPSNNNLWRSEEPFEYAVQASDQGLGVDRIQVETEDGLYEVWDPGCDGTHASPCELEASASPNITVDPSEFEEGLITTTWTTAVDPTGDQSNAAFDSFKIDKTDPEIDLGGSFMSAPSMTLTSDVYVLEILATDGTPSEPNSGAWRVEVYVDDVMVERKDAWSCPTDNCSVDYDYFLESDDYSNGPHELRVEALDRVGHVGQTDTVDFEVDR